MRIKLHILLLMLMLCALGVGAQERWEKKVFFSLGSASICDSIIDNRQTLDDLVKVFGDFIQDSLVTIEMVKLESFTSPEGDKMSNDILAHQRSNSVLNYLQEQTSLPDSIYKIDNIGIAWDMLKAMVASSDMEHNTKVIEIIENTPEETWRRVNPNDRWLTLVDSRNKQLMDLAYGKPYHYMQQKFFPSLCSTSVVTIYYKKKIKPIITEEKKIESAEVNRQADSVLTNTPLSTCEPPKVRTKESKPLFALKTNLLFDAATILNIEAEVPIGKRWSVAGEWIFPWWITSDNANAIQILSGNLEGKYWFGMHENRPVMSGWFVGLYAGGGLYDLQYKNNGYQGEFYIAAGLSAGYAHTINKSGSLRMEYSLGVGYLQTDYRYYKGMQNNQYLVWQHDGSYTWFGPTKAKVSLVWLINSKMRGARR